MPSIKDLRRMNYFQCAVPGCIEGYPEIVRNAGGQRQQPIEVLPRACKRGADYRGLNEDGPSRKAARAPPLEIRRVDLSQVFIDDDGVGRNAGVVLQSAIEYCHFSRQPNVILVGEEYEFAATLVDRALKITYVSDAGFIAQYTNPLVLALRHDGEGGVGRGIIRYDDFIVGRELRNNAIQLLAYKTFTLAGSEYY
jgi:hypothetical protein